MPATCQLRLISRASRRNGHPVFVGPHRDHRGYRTSPGPTFKARVLHSKNVVSAEKGGARKISSIAARNRTVWGRDLLRVGVTGL